MREMVERCIAHKHYAVALDTVEFRVPYRDLVTCLVRTRVGAPRYSCSPVL